MSTALKRIMNKDMKMIQKMDLKSLGIYVQFDEENILKARAMIIGPPDTPFENGILFFLIEFPTNYPYSPPKISYFSNSRYRIHPNLYVGKSKDNYLGKVCLSIINTWSGPQWTTVMHIGSILLSVQSLLCENPLHNEPGFENETGERNDNYNRIVLYDTFQNLILANGFEIPEEFSIFKNDIQNHLIEKKDKIQSKIDQLAKETPNKIKIILNIYGITMILDYKKLSNSIASKLNLI